MKKLLVPLFFITFALSVGAEEVIHFKDGAVLNGSIVEVYPGKSFRVKTTDGALVDVWLDDVEKIERTEATTSLFEQTKQPFGLKKGYRGFVYGEYVGANLYGGGMTTIHGAQVNDHWFFGGGMGIRFDVDNDEYKRIPIFANIRYDFNAGKVSPFVDANFGFESICYLDYNRNRINSFDLYGSLNVGCRIRRFQVSAGAEFSRNIEKVGCYIDSYGYRVYPELKYQPSFVAKLGFEF